jgi:hypothetical protein
MQNLPTDASHYRVLASTPPVATAPPNGTVPAKITAEQGARKSRKGKPGAVTPKGPKKERKRQLAQKREGEQRGMQRERQERERAEQEVQQIALFQLQLEEQNRERALKERKEREFHTHQRRLVLQQRLQEGQDAWRLEWQRQQPYLREQLHAEELLLQAQERQGSELDMIYGQYLQDFTQLN